MWDFLLKGMTQDTYYILYPFIPFTGNYSINESKKSNNRKLNR